MMSSKCFDFARYWRLKKITVQQPRRNINQCSVISNCFDNFKNYFQNIIIKVEVNILHPFHEFAISYNK